MIRYIDLKGQGTQYAFAFWDTITDSFIEVGTDQAWDNKADLEEGAKIAGLDKRILQRMLRLIPDG